MASLIFTTITFITIVFLVDVIERLDKFVDSKVPLPVILRFYGLYIPEKLRLILPAATLIASLFTMHKLRRHGELTAMRSNGVSLRRVFAPILLTVFCICGLSLISNEYWPLPVTSRMRHEISREYINREPSRSLRHLKNLTLQENRNRVLNIGVYDAELKRASQIDIQRVENNRIVERITGAEMNWDTDHWNLIGGIRRTFSNGDEQVETLAENAPLSLRIQPDDLERMGVNLQPEEMTYQELEQYIRDLQALGQDPRKWRVELHNKIAFPLSAFIIAMFGLSLAASPPWGRTSAGWGLALLFCLIYLGINVKVGPELGVKKVLTPELAAWIGNIGFGVLGIISILRVKN